MADNFAFYAQTCDALPDERMRELAGDADRAVEQTDDGRRFTYRWPDLTVTVNEMPAGEVPQHLDGFCGYVRHIYNGEPDGRGGRVLDRIRYTRLVAGVAIEPGRDAEGRAERILGAMAHGLNALLFHGSALYDQDAGPGRAAGSPRTGSLRPGACPSASWPRSSSCCSPPRSSTPSPGRTAASAWPARSITLLEVVEAIDRPGRGKGPRVDWPKKPSGSRPPHRRPL
jgi:hypothetical protein